MSDFDRSLAKCIGGALHSCSAPTRDIIAVCYRETLLASGTSEDQRVSEKWIDYIWERVRGINLAGRSSDQIARAVFERIAKD